MCDIHLLIGLYFVHQHIYSCVKHVFNTWYLYVKWMNLWMNTLCTIFIINSSHVKFVMNCFKKVVVDVLDSLCAQLLPFKLKWKYTIMKTNKNAMHLCWMGLRLNDPIESEEQIALTTTKGVHVHTIISLDFEWIHWL